MPQTFNHEERARRHLDITTCSWLFAARNPDQPLTQIPFLSRHDVTRLSVCRRRCQRKAARIETHLAHRCGRILDCRRGRLPLDGAVGPKLTRTFPAPLFNTQLAFAEEEPEGTPRLTLQSKLGDQQRLTFEAAADAPTRVELNTWQSWQARESGLVHCTAAHTLVVVLQRSA